MVKGEGKRGKDAGSISLLTKLKFAVKMKKERKKSRTWAKLKHSLQEHHSIKEGDVMGKLTFENRGM